MRRLQGKRPGLRMARSNDFVQVLVPVNSGGGTVRGPIRYERESPPRARLPR